MDGVTIQVKDGPPYRVVPYLIKKVGDTENVGFRVYRDGLRLFQFNDLDDLGNWFGSIIIEATLDMKPEE